MSNQRVYKAHGIVLRRIAFGETDKILTVFTRERGKLGAIAKGARRATSRLVGATEPLTYAELLLAVGQNLDVVTQAEVRESFRGVHGDLEKISCGTYLLELTNAALEERQPNPELFDLLLATLHVLERIDQPDLAARMFELKAMRVLGYEPQLYRCVRDQASLEGPRLVFSPSRGGMLCLRCSGEGGAVIHLARPTLARMREIMDADPKDVPALHPTNLERGQMARALTAYVRDRLDSPLRSLHFLEDLRVTTSGDPMNHKDTKDTKHTKGTGVRGRTPED